jgi:beta-glucosidase
MEKFISDLLSKMTLAQKVGQLNQLRGIQYVDANKSERSEDLEKQVRLGRVGTFLNVPYEDKVRFQKIAVEESPNGIPLIFAMDVIHGFRTIFPNPLAEAASWDLSLMEKSARIAAEEAASDGYMWTFAPMVDVAHDARWGRIMEGAGEDPYLGSRIAEARVRGFQSDDLSRHDTILACAKHFAAYGQSMAGRDYNQTTISRRFLHDYVLPPFEAACKAGVATFMNAFNDFDGVPCSGNRYLVTDILKERWGFEGFTVSDWESFKEMVNWGHAADLKHAAELAIKAGSDVDMISYAYIDHLEELVKEGTVAESLVDQSVSRLLGMKVKLGLFDDPYRYFSENRKKSALRTNENIAHAREMAAKSMVLLKNDEGVLPLKREDYSSVAVIGPIDGDRENYLGAWKAMGDKDDVVTLTQGIINYYDNDKEVHYAPGCDGPDKGDSKLLEIALQTVRESSLVILTLGEGWKKAGENTSLADINLPQCQIELAKAVWEICEPLGKPVVCIMVNARPMIFNWIGENMPVILEAWVPGNEAGNAMADVLFGKCNPGGKLPVSFPRSTGQCPLSYLKKNTGRPNDGTKFTTCYLDESNDPAYPFGYGLSYSEFEYSALALSASEISPNEEIVVSFSIFNKSNVDGEETAQLYIRDKVASVTRPLMELKRFEKLKILAGERVNLTFTLTIEDLKFWNQDMKYVAEPGEFEVLVGRSSTETQSCSFKLI